MSKATNNALFSSLYDGRVPMVLKLAFLTFINSLKKNIHDNEKVPIYIRALSRCEPSKVEYTYDSARNNKFSTYGK